MALRVRLLPGERAQPEVPDDLEPFIIQPFGIAGADFKLAIAAGRITIGPEL